MLDFLAISDQQSAVSSQQSAVSGQGQLDLFGSFGEEQNTVPVKSREFIIVKEDNQINELIDNLKKSNIFSFHINTREMTFAGNPNDI